MSMFNTTLSLSKLLTNNWCNSLTGSVYLYGHLLPVFALLVFGLTFNPIALYYFSTSRNFRRSAYSFYFSAIAVVDLIRLTVWFLFYLLDYKIFKLKLHPLECPSQLYIESVTSCISAWLTVCLTLERCLVIYKPLQTVTDTRGKRALIVIFIVIFASCFVNSLVLQPGFYTKRVYREQSSSIVCYYEKNTIINGTLVPPQTWLTPPRKRVYLLFIVIFRVAVPFLLLLISNVALFVSVRQTSQKPTNDNNLSLVRHGHHRRITPMIFFSSCILLLTISPRYLLQFFLNFYKGPPDCSLTHLAPHILKTLELFNYAFNVFVSIVSGKHGRRELFDMLLCRSIQSQTLRFNVSSKLVPLGTTRSSMRSKSSNPQRPLTKRTEFTADPTQKLLHLSPSNSQNSVNRQAVRHNHYHFQ